MVMNIDNKDYDERKLAVIKLRLLQMESDNVVKKESKAAMVDKAYKLIIQEVDKK